MAALKVRRIGNSLGVILPAAVLERLNVKEGDDLYLVPTNRADEIVLTASYPEFAEAMEIFGEGRRRYRNALKALSER